MELIKQEVFDTEYITELKHRSFHTTMTLSAEGISDAVLSVLEEEPDHNVSIMIIGHSSDKGGTTLLKYEEL